MPRTNGVYTPPAGTKAAPNTTIRSAPYNALVDDLTADANAARPITAGGTGATNATKARENLGAIASADILAAPLKETPVEGDTLVLLDSEDDGKLKRTLWSKIKGLVDGVYLKLAGGTLTGDIVIKKPGTKVLSFNRADGSLVGNIYGAQDDATGVNIAVADKAGANQKFFSFGANGDLSAPGILRGAGAVLTGSALGVAVSGSRSAFSANGEGGAYASMYKRGAPFYSSMTLDGSSYAPIIAGRYSNPGWNGIWSAGVINFANAQSAGFVIQHINSGGGEQIVAEFRADGSLRLGGPVYRGGTSAVYNDGGTYSINITGNAGYATSAGSADTAANVGGWTAQAFYDRIEDRSYWRTRDYLMAEGLAVGVPVYRPNGGISGNAGDIRSLGAWGTMPAGSYQAMESFQNGSTRMWKRVG
ncbi:hypothetical protein [Brucella intermedia]|uniref:hypothetical protein n=1 Tax=Brucella intermedia TaxID=94625 RepID=UPI00235FC706|nr:hypothetical protein [Brucella intermedia]